MYQTRLRALLAGATSASLIMLLILPSGGLAGPPSRDSDRGVFLDCSLTSDDGTLFFGAILSEVNGTFAGLDAFGPGGDPSEDPPTFVTSPDEDPTGSYVDGQFTLQIPVVDGTTGDPGGSAMIQATLEAVGRPEHFNDSFGGGNQKNREAGSILPLSIAAGTAVLPDGSAFELVDGQCEASEFDVRSWGNNPTSFVDRFASRGVSCELEDETGPVGFLFVDFDDHRTTAFVDAFVDPELGAFADVPVVDGHVSATLEYESFDTGDPAGTGEIDMTIATTGERFSFTLRGGTMTERVRGELFDVSGTLTAPGHDPFDLEECDLLDLTAKVIDTQPSGPKSTGKPPANDLPSGALAVSIGTKLNQQTGNAALDMEEPTCLVEQDEEGNEVPIGILRTVWFSLIGTGAEVTIDTAGSGFDTVIAVYTEAADGSLELVDGACVDDVPLEPVGETLQAAVTFEAADGTTYLIQVGGFPDDDNWGRLRLSVR